MDFTDSNNPIEIGYFDRGPISEDSLGTGGFGQYIFMKETRHRNSVHV